MKNLKKPLLFALCLLPVAALGGLLVGMYTFEYYPEATRQLMLAQVGSYGTYLLITTLQSALYGLVAAFFGYVLADKIGLLRPFGFTRRTLVRTGLVTVLCGVALACDYFLFVPLIPALAAEYAMGISPAYFFSSLIYGGIMEEILMRFFLLSLLSFLLWKLAARKQPREHIPTWVFVASNVAVALVFAAGHLPTSVSLFGALTPMIVLRCFLFNGALGLVFGRFYRKYGIQYAVLGHFGCHLVSKLILLAAL